MDIILAFSMVFATYIISHCVNLFLSSFIETWFKIDIENNPKNKVIADLIIVTIVIIYFNATMIFCNVQGYEYIHIAAIVGPIIAFLLYKILCRKDIKCKTESAKSYISAFAIAGIVTFCIGFAYQQGYDDHVYYADDNSPIVYITNSGEKYHRKSCKYVRNNNAAAISLLQAEKAGYTRCSVCKPVK